MSAYVIPVIFLLLIILSLVKRKNSYSAFIDGANEGITLIGGVFPYLLAIMMAVEVFRASGISQTVANFFSPCMKVFGIPPELTELIIIRPLSGAGALSVLDGIFTTYGADSHIAKCACIIYGSSETVFYLSTIYFSKSNVKKLGYAIPVSLLCTFTGCVIGCSLI